MQTLSSSEVGRPSFRGDVGKQEVSIFRRGTSFNKGCKYVHRTQIELLSLHGFVAQLWRYYELGLKTTSFL